MFDDNYLLIRDELVEDMNIKAVDLSSLYNFFSMVNT